MTDAQKKPRQEPRGPAKGQPGGAMMEDMMSHCGQMMPQMMSQCCGTAAEGEEAAAEPAGDA